MICGVRFRMTEILIVCMILLYPSRAAKANKIAAFDSFYRRGLSVDLAETPVGDPSAKRRIADGLFYSFPKTSPQCLHELPNVGIP